MKRRGKISKKQSRREFRRGDKTHTINVKQAPARGGIRL